MLSSSDASHLPMLRDVVKSTAAVIFPGTPHRGKPELAVFAECARLAVRSLLFELSWAIMDALSLKNTDVEQTQEAFSRLWQTYGFQVKTFHDRLGLTGLRLVNMGNKVVPDHSSLIGDRRERVENIRADHKAASPGVTIRTTAETLESLGPSPCRSRTLACQQLGLGSLNIARTPLYQGLPRPVGRLGIPGTEEASLKHSGLVSGNCHSRA